MRATTMRTASVCAALLAIGGLTVACGDDNGGGTDSGVDGGPRDAGQDSGGDLDSGPVPEDGGGGDAGADAGPPPANLRLAHLIPGGPDVHVCLQFGSTWQLITRDSVTRAPQAIPYKGVSPYIPVALPPIPINVAVYPSDVAGLATGTCPTATTEAIITQMINGGDFASGAFYTVAATGLPGVTTSEQAPELNVIPDDLAPPATAGSTRLRFYNAVPNFPVTIPGVDLCFDPDGPGTAADPEELVENASFEEVNDYLEHTPIAAGLLTLHAYNAAAGNCNMTPATGGGTLLAQIPVPLPLPAGVPENYTATFDADTSNTLFLIGDFTVVVIPMTACTDDTGCAAAGPSGTFCSIPAGGSAGYCSHPNAVSVLPIEDSLGLTL